MKNVDTPDIYEILDTYKPDNSLFTDEQEDMLRLKNAVYSLSEPDKRIILLYAHYGNLRDVAKILKVSVTTTSKNVKRIRSQIYRKIL